MTQPSEPMHLTFYTDTHIDRQVAVQLSSRGVDIIRCQDVGMQEASDEAHLTFAAEQNRVLITFDKGFRDRAFSWLAAGRNHAGVFICKHGLQGKDGIGTIVKTCLFYHEAVEAGAADVSEFRNQAIDIE